MGSTESNGQISPVGNFSVIRSLCDLVDLDSTVRSSPKTVAEGEIVAAAGAAAMKAETTSKSGSTASLEPSSVQTKSSVDEDTDVRLRIMAVVSARGLFLVSLYLTIVPGDVVAVTCAGAAAAAGVDGVNVVADAGVVKSAFFIFREEVLLIGVVPIKRELADICTTYRVVLRQSLLV